MGQPGGSPRAFGGCDGEPGRSGIRRIRIRPDDHAAAAGLSAVPGLASPPTTSCRSRSPGCTRTGLAGAVGWTTSTPTCRKILVHAFYQPAAFRPGTRRVVLADSPPDAALDVGVDREAAIDRARRPGRGCRPGSGPRWCCGSTATWTWSRRPLALGCSPGTVKSQTAKGLAALRRVLEPSLGGADRG